MTLDTAVVGGGVVSRVHLPGLKRSPLVDLVAICDLDEERAREASRKYGIRAYLDVDEMLREESLDWLHVCTSVQTHRDLAITAIEAGVPVLIEKPVTVTSEELADVEAASRRHDVPFSVVRNHLFTPEVVEARRRIAAGELGDLRGVDVVYTGNTRPDESRRGAWTFELPGGEFEEGIPHPIYLGLGVGGVPRTHGDATATTSIHGDYERDFTYDGLGLQWVTDDDVLCSVKTMVDSIPQRFVLVHGEERSLTVDLVANTTVELDRNYIASPLSRALNNVDHTLGRIRGTASNAVGVARRSIASDWETEKRWESHYYQYDLEARALLADDDPPIPMEEVRWTVELVELVRERASASRDERRDAPIDRHAPDAGADD